MKNKFVVCAILYIVCVEAGNDDLSSDYNVVVLQGKKNQTKNVEQHNNDNKCWMSLRAKKLFEVMDNLDMKYENNRKEAQLYLDSIEFDHKMIQGMVTERGAAQREKFKIREVGEPILPAGINLGGLSIMKLPSSVLFFHRLKLRNDTFFKVRSLHNDLENMVLKANLYLNDLHLVGAYDRSMTDNNPGVLIYTPSFGELEISMEDVKYSIEGRYRLISNRLVIELIVSTIDAKNIWMKYINDTVDKSIPIEKKHMGDFILRLKSDLDKWVQDYFNDYLILQDLSEMPNISTLREYEQNKTMQLTLFTHNALILMNKKLHYIGASSVSLPSFKTITSYGLTVSMYGGTLKGLDSMYRRSVPTNILKSKNLRYVDTIIGFNNLEVSYKYKVIFPAGSSVKPGVSGIFYFKSTELAAHLSLGLNIEPEVVEVDIDFINRIGPESVIVEGAANLFIANFKHILRHELASIMSTALGYGVRMIRTLPRCSPFESYMLPDKNNPELMENTDEDKDSDRFGLIYSEELHNGLI